MRRRGLATAAALAALCMASISGQQVPVAKAYANGGAGEGAQAAMVRPLPPAPASFADEQALADYIDLALSDSWQAEGLTPSAPVDDVTWLRRLSLDLRGEIANADEIQRLLADVAPDRRARWIDAFLGDRRFATQLANRWTKLLLVGAGMNSTRMVRYVRPWLETQFAANRPFRDVVTQMLTDTCDSEEVDGCGLMLAYFDSIESLTAITARSFLGLQIQCAQCHDHPFDKWKQDDFNRFAGFFADSRADFAPLKDRAVAEDAEAKLEARREAKREARRAAETAGGAKGRAGSDGGMRAMGVASDPAGVEILGELEDSPIRCGFVVEDLAPEMVLSKNLRKLERRANSGGKVRARKAMSGDAPENPPSDPAGMEMAAAAGGDGESAPGTRVERADGAAINDLLRLLQQAARAGDKAPLSVEKASARLAKEKVAFDRLVAQLQPDARALFDKYEDRRESFSTPGFPDGSKFVSHSGVSKREELARWIVAPANPWFGASIANRVVQQLLGKGLVEPVDDLSGSVDRVMPELLDVIGRAFHEHGTDLRFLFGAIARTHAYALGAATSADAWTATESERRLAAHPARALTLDQFCRSLRKATDPAFGTANEAEAIAKEEWEVRAQVHTLSKLCTAPDGTGLIWWSASIPQALFAMNSETSTIGPADVTTTSYASFADVGLDPVARLSPLWRQMIGRAPAPDEAARLLALLPGDAARLPTTFSELRWALLNSTEFQVNH
ncbi:MAG: DUF1549 domain-containing protein [Planctomycetes bacterium]|nr:DUF1549 domain-containing protein [Planctomycetota bacterium]